MKIAIGNTTTYGGAGGPWATTTRHPVATEVVVHEVGHSFAFLDDEYVDDALCPTSGASANSDIDSTRQSVRGIIPWTLWIDPSTPVPTTTNADGIPGLYEGAHYCPTGQYRPTFNSLMRATFRPLGQINEEQFVKRIRAFARPLAASGPKVPSLTVHAGELERFTVVPSKVALPGTDDLGVTWRIDGTVVGSGAVLVVDPAGLGAGTHTVTASSADTSSKVRKDPGGVMARTITWSLDKATTAAPGARTSYRRAAGCPRNLGRRPGHGLQHGHQLWRGGSERLHPGLDLERGHLDVLLAGDRPRQQHPIGPANPTFTVAGGGKTFVVALTTNATFTSRDFFVIARCANALDSRTTLGVNSLTVTSRVTAPPDIISIAATVGLPGILTLPAHEGLTVFALAALNIGADAPAIRVQPSAGGDALPVATTICETNPSTGACLATPTTHVVASLRPMRSGPSAFSPRARARSRSIRRPIDCMSRCCRTMAHPRRPISSGPRPSP